MGRYFMLFLLFAALASGLLSLAHSDRWRHYWRQQPPSSFLGSLTASPSLPIISSPPTNVEVPGPSEALLKQPFYTCIRNFYVETTGNDSDDGSARSPWRTIQNADKSSRTGGDCINVAPGLYQAHVLIQHGGSGPTAAGYVVYRCEALDACHVLAPGGSHLWGFKNSGNFVIVDGFELDGNNALQIDGIADACIGTDDPTYGAARSSGEAGASSHHIWVLNSVIHHCNLAGVSLAGKEWFYTIHNVVYHNAWTSGYQGSGINYVVVQCIETGEPNCYTSGIAGAPSSDYSYAPNGNDLVLNPPRGYYPFHNVVAWNVVYDNRINYTNTVGCSAHTDGNGIIMDSFYDGFSNIRSYPYQTLVMNNVSYYNGGRGIHIFRASNITVANNTVYNNMTDTCLASAGSRRGKFGELSQQGGVNNVWINNISKVIQNYKENTCSLVAGDGGGVNDMNNTFVSNLLSDNGCVYQNDASSFSCANNKCRAEPGFTSATPGAAGGTKNQPTGGAWIPGKNNLAITTSSPAYNYGRAKSYLPPQNSDAGACNHELANCP
jgi:parallel beta-helix repeat protein